MGSSRIRFVMLEADIADGEFAQVAQAISHALRPSPPVVAPKLAVSAPHPVEMPTTTWGELEEPDLQEDELEATPPANMARKASRVPRKYRSPNVIEVDLLSEVPFATFAAQKAPTNDHKRFLTVAAWFKQHRGTDAITMDHVYTCYRAAKWPTNIEDFDLPLRTLKARKLMDRKDKGLYAINHLGVAEVDALGSSPEN